MSDIKLNDLVNWVDKNEKDPIMDSPYNFNKRRTFMTEFNFFKSNYRIS
jgi:hypothetical protein